MTEHRILVLGGSGLLGGTVARHLLRAGHPVRVTSRTAGHLDALAAAGAEPCVADLRDPASLARACEGVRQIVSTANGLMGRGREGPARVDVAGYRALVTVARDAGVERLVHVSAQGIAPDHVVDYFRVKWAVDDVIRGSGLAWVLLQPSAFMDIWIDRIIGGDVATRRRLTIFGDGSRISNFIAVDDVAAAATAIVARPEVAGDVQVGGPSNLSFRQVADVIERECGTSLSRNHVPVPVLRWGARLVRPFNEVAARMMMLGYWSATTDQPFPGWRETADRLGLSPISVEAYVRERFVPALRASGS